MGAEEALVLTADEWVLLAAICEFFITEASEHAHASRALCHRILATEQAVEC